MPGDCLSTSHLDFEALAKAYVQDETALVTGLTGIAKLFEAERAKIGNLAAELVTNVRKDASSTGFVDDVLLEYGLSTQEGITLMRLAEALIRTPDFATARMLIRDKIAAGKWSDHTGESPSFLVNRATNGLQLTSAWINATGGVEATGLIAKLGDHVMHAAMTLAMAMMGNHFVLGRSIKEALSRAHKDKQPGLCYSFDMLGEAAHTQKDADRYFDDYLRAMKAIAAKPKQSDMRHNAGLSVKLSALNPRYEFATRDKCVPDLVARLTELALIAQEANLWFNIDAEEADRLEVSLLVFEQLLKDERLKDWQGLGLVVQAYQRRAIPVIEQIAGLARANNRNIAIRLVKGAYWDMEIKRAQELGLKSFPVFTRKENTDLSYLACARRLFEAQDVIYPQFATHNAHTMAAIAHMAGEARYEFQRLHGMGEALHDDVCARFGVVSRVYAPVGKHKDLLPYLVRRLLENGANSSFVNQMMDEEIAVETVITDPLAVIAKNASMLHPNIRAPMQIAEAERQTAKGIDVTQARDELSLTLSGSKTTLHTATSLINGKGIEGQSRPVFSPQNRDHQLGTVHYGKPELVGKAIDAAQSSNWASAYTPHQRSEIIAKVGDLMEAEMPLFVELCVREAGKTYLDAIAEIREAVDFCRYYAVQALRDEMTSRAPLGIVACISPWNFPLAIFAGQIVAALAMGNTVIAKPAEQTPLIAAKAVSLMHRAGIPPSALHLLIGDGAELGTAMTRAEQVKGVCFTGSTRTAKRIAKALAETGRADIPFIAETGGINAMIVDSTALLEQAVQDTLDSAFQSAGQRCSACRIVCVQEDIADSFITMLKGAMDELTIGDPIDPKTDIGPVIDNAALNMIESYKAEHDVYQNTLSEGHEAGHFTAPALLEMSRVSDVTDEIFGPVLHLVRFKSDGHDPLISEINALGFGLTMGVHTRIDRRVEEISAQAHIGNLYVNRNQIGAVVGIHPFGGEGLSGTGPKAGGPNYLLGLSRVPQKRSRHIVADDRALEKSPTQNAKRALDIAQKSAKHWAIQPIEMRFQDVSNHLPDAEKHIPNVRYSLPGPTGEENTLTLVPRGIMLCFGGDDKAVLAHQTAKALLAGSVAIAVNLDENGETISQNLPESSKGLIASVSLADALSLLSADIDGVVADGAMRDLIAPILALREGAIFPCLQKNDPIERYFHERTLTVNTTAAGGNASLLAL